MATYTLSYDGVSIAVESQGAELSSYNAGREFIWPGDPNVWAGHGPVLFPVVGSLIDDTIKIAGQPYKMRKHGFLRKQEFALEEAGIDYLRMVFRATEETRAMYPFDFTFHITHKIDSCGFTTTFSVKNDSNNNMPFCIGGHPGFICPMEKGAAFTDYQLKFPCPEDGRNTLCPNGYIITGEETLPEFKGDTLPLKHEYFDAKDALMLTGLKSRSVKLINKNTDKGIEFSFADFEALGVWSAPGKCANYVCLEPWRGLPAFEGETGNIEDKPFVRFLSPGKTDEVSYSVKIIE